MPKLCAKTGYRVYATISGGVKMVVKSDPKRVAEWLFKFVSGSTSTVSWMPHSRLSHEHVLELGWMPYTGPVCGEWLK